MRDRKFLRLAESCRSRGVFITWHDMYSSYVPVIIISHHANHRHQSAVDIQSLIVSSDHSLRTIHHRQVDVGSFPCLSLATRRALFGLWPERSSATNTHSIFCIPWFFFSLSLYFEKQKWFSVGYRFGQLFQCFPPPSISDGRMDA